MAEFKIENQILVQYTGNEKVVEIPSNVTAIDEKTFMGNTKIKKIILPDSIKKIEKQAFYACSKLESINLPDGIEIGESAFEHCDNLKSISENEEIILNIIGSRVFCWCEKLETDIIIDIRLQEIGEWAFGFCKRISNIILPENIEINEAAFSCCERLKKISETGQIYLGKLSESAFSYCNKLETDIFINQNVKAIERGTFDSCKTLKRVILPNGIDIKERAFNGCTSLESISEVEGITLEKVDNHAFSWCESLKTEITIDEKIKCLGDNAFLYCKKLRRVNISENTEYGEYTFLECTNLDPECLKKKEVENEQIEKKSENVISEDIISKDIVSEKIEEFVIKEGILESYNGTKEIVYVPREVKEIGESAFENNENVREVYFEGNIKKIGAEAFWNCENLVKTYIPNGIEIGESAFENCRLLERISKKQKYLLGKTGARAFNTCEVLSNDIEILEGTIELEEDIFGFCTEISKIFIPDSLKKVDEYCFGDVKLFVCKNNAEIYMFLRDRGYECIMLGQKGRNRLEEIESNTTLCLSCGERIGRWDKKCSHCGSNQFGENNEYYPDERTMRQLKKALNNNSGKNISGWESIFPEDVYSVEEQWLYGIHPNDKTYEKLLELEVIRKFSKK